MTIQSWGWAFGPEDEKAVDVSEFIIEASCEHVGLAASAIVEATEGAARILERDGGHEYLDLFEAVGRAIERHITATREKGTA